MTKEFQIVDYFIPKPDKKGKCAYYVGNIYL